VNLFPVAGIRVSGSAVDVVDKEVTSLSDVSEGDVRRGFIVSAGSVGVLVRYAPALLLLFVILFSFVCYCIQFCLLSVI